MTTKTKAQTKPCLVCDKPVYYKRSTENRAKYCSVACKAKAQLGAKIVRTKPLTGEIIACETCGIKFYRFPSELKRGKRKYCSFACRNKGDYLGQNLRGSNHHAWKGGRMRLQGYIYIRSLEHPSKNSNGYVAEHRLVMEKYLGRYLTPEESIHHRNAIKDDNRIENLQVVVGTIHKGTVDCPYCEKEFLIR